MAHPEIEEWLRTALGVAMNPDGSYGLQCVDLADQYAQDLFKVHWSKSIGGVIGANGLLDSAPDKYWIRIDNNGDPNQIPQRGDVIVWAGNGANPYGHVAVVLSADRNGVDVLQQDGFAAPLQFVNGGWYSAKPTHKARLGYTNPGTGHTLGWLRPRLTAPAAPAPKPAPAKPAETLQSFQRTLGATKTAYRKAASTNGTLVQWFEPGKTYDFKGFVRGEVVNGNGIWFVGKYTGHYVWSGGFTSSSTAGLPDLTPTPKPEVLAQPNERTVAKVAANLRKGAGTNFGTMTAPGAENGQLKPDHTYPMKGYVKGQAVDGNDIWFVTQSGGYVHSGAFTNKGITGLANLTPAAPTTPVVSPAPKPAPAPVTPVVPPGYSFTKDVTCVTEVKPAGVGHFQADGLPKRPLKIVVHQFDAAEKSVGADSVISWFQSPDNPSWSSSHFVIHGTRIVQMVKLGDRAYHAGPGGNDYIGIETYVTAGGNDRDTFNSLIRLIKELEAKYGYKFEIIDHRSVASTSCGADINIPAITAAVSAQTAPTVPPAAPAPVPTPPATPAPATDELAEFAAYLHKQIDAFVASKRK